MIEQIATNIHHPSVRIADSNLRYALGTMIPTPTFIFGSKSQKRLVVSAEMIRYYEKFYRPTPAANIQCNPVMKKF